MTLVTRLGQKENNKENNFTACAGVSAWPGPKLHALTWYNLNTLNPFYLWNIPPKSILATHILSWNYHQDLYTLGCHTKECVWLNGFLEIYPVSNCIWSLVKRMNIPMKWEMRKMGNLDMMHSGRVSGDDLFPNLLSDNEVPRLIWAHLTILSLQATVRLLIVKSIFRCQGQGPAQGWGSYGIEYISAVRLLLRLCLDCVI